jgi:hypothetical protein
VAGVPIAASWNGATWSLQTLPNSTGGLGSVSCATSSTCVAVGDDASGNAIADVWDGTSWSALAVPAPSAATHTYLHSVSCDSATDCLAVGEYTTSTGGATLAEHYDGAAFSIVPSP